MDKRFSVSWVIVIWLVVGVVVTINHHYGDQLQNASQVATFTAGVLLWPVLATGGNVFIAF
jgi:hypothetical protein